MKKGKFRRSLPFVLASCALASILFAGSAFATWKFFLSETIAKEVGAKADDLAENYEFGSSSSRGNAEYTLYLFPSAVYLDWYYDYLEETESTALGSISVKPEELFGCIEATIDENDEVTYTYSPSAGGDDGYLSFMAKVGSETQSVKNYFINSSWNTAAYVTPYSNNTDWDTTVTLADGTTCNLYDYGDPTLDKAYKDIAENDNTVYGTDNGMISARGEANNYRYLHAFDRLGYWSELARGGGRYLPLKVTVDKAYSGEKLAQILLSPLADMGDTKGWYCYSFTGWAYCKPSSDGSAPDAPYYANKFLSGNGSKYDSKTLAAFGTAALDYAFDASEDFSQYADSDGVIRLFPTFSQGKTYNSGKNYVDGGGDALRIQPTYTSDFTASNPIVQHDLYLTYLQDGGTYTASNDATASETRAAALRSVNLSEYSSFTVQAALESKLADWNSNWKTVYTVDAGKITEEYGEGLYNIYLFVSNVGDTGQNCSSAFSCLKDDLTNGEGNAHTIFKDLTYKTFFYGLDSGGNSLSPKVSTKTFCLLFEKVYDPKVFTIEKPTETDGSGNLAFNTADVKNAYANATNAFKLVSAPLYSVTANDIDVPMSDNSVDTSQQLQYDHPNVYLYYGLDMTAWADLYFQIRYQEAKRSDVRIARENESNADAGLGSGYDLIYNPQSDGTFTGDSRFRYAIAENADDANGYFTFDYYTVTGSDASTQEFFKLKDTSAAGVYDILVVEDRTPEGTEAYENGKTTTLYIYAYKHTQAWVKILANDATDTDNDGLANHNFSENTAIDNCLIYKRAYSLADQMQVYDNNQTEGYAGGSFSLSGYNQFSTWGESLALCVNAYVNALCVNKSILPDQVTLRDHVTGAVMARYTEWTDDGSVAPDGSTAYSSLALAYGGKTYMLTFEDFFIRKNYVVYVSCTEADETTEFSSEKNNALTYSQVENWSKLGLEEVSAETDYYTGYYVKISDGYTLSDETTSLSAGYYKLFGKYEEGAYSFWVGGTEGVDFYLKEGNTPKTTVEKTVIVSGGTGSTTFSGLTFYQVSKVEGLTYADARVSYTDAGSGNYATDYFIRVEDNNVANAPNGYYRLYENNPNSNSYTFYIALNDTSRPNNVSNDFKYSTLGEDYILDVGTTSTDWGFNVVRNESNGSVEFSQTIYSFKEIDGAKRTYSNLAVRVTGEEVYETGYYVKVAEDSSVTVEDGTKIVVTTGYYRLYGQYKDGTYSFWILYGKARGYVVKDAADATFSFALYANYNDSTT